MEKLIQLLEGFANDISELKAWRAEQTQRQAEEDAKILENQREFESWLQERQTKEQHEEEQAKLLRDMMV